MKGVVLSLLVGSVLIVTAAASSEPTAGTLSLDALSFVSFDGAQNFPIPAGSTIRFEFGDVIGGQASFTIDPSDVAIAPIPLGDNDAVLLYRLASGSTGIVRRVDGSTRIEFSATIQASTVSSAGSSANLYSLVFTTETAVASNATQTEQIEVEGVRVVPGPNYVQLVGGATNQPDAIPRPGTAVYAVLSGTFDWFPSLP